MDDDVLDKLSRHNYEDTVESIRETFDLDWENPPTVGELSAEVQDALNDVASNHERIRHWLKLRDAERLEHQAGKSGIQPKLVRKQAEWRYSSLSEPYLSTEDLFDCKPVTAEDVAAAQHNKLILNHQFNNDINKTAFIDTLVRTLTDEGTAFIKVGWEYEEALTTTVDTVEAEDGTIEFTSKPYEILVPVVNRPSLEVCHYTSVIPDPTCEGDMDNATFVAYRYQTAVKDLEATGLYKNLEHIGHDQRETLLDLQLEHTHNFKFKDRARRKVTVTEYWGEWDIRDDGTVEPILACFAGDTLIRLEINPFPDGKPPFISIPYLPVKNSLYGEPDAALTEDNQEIIGATMRGVVDLLAKSANSQTGIRKGFLDALNQRRFERGDDYVFNPISSPSEAIYMHQFPTIPNSALQLIESQNVEAESITGVKAYHGGIGGESLGRTATGARGALDAASKRELGILRRISNGIVQLGYKVMSMNSVFLSPEETIRITNEEFLSITRDSLNGDVDIKLTISTAESDNDSAEDLGYLLQTVGPSMPMEMTQLILSEIATLRKMPHLAQMIKQYAPEPDPLAQERAQLEMELLRAQIAYTQARAIEHGAGADLRTEKIDVEKARARNLAGKADLDDMKFVKEADRTDHREALEAQENAMRTHLDTVAGEALLQRSLNPDPQID